DGLLDKPEGVDVLQLGPRTELLLTDLTNGDICIAPETALLHIAVIDVEILQDLLESPQVVVRFCRRTDIRFADDFNQRHTASIEIEIGISARIRKTFVKRFAGILFHVDSLNADFLHSPVHGDLNKTMPRQRPIVLGDLIPLWEVRIEIILTSPLRFRIDRAIQA